MKNSLKFLLLLVVGVLFLSGCGDSNSNENSVEKENNSLNTEEVSKEDNNYTEDVINNEKEDESDEVTNDATDEDSEVAENKSSDFNVESMEKELVTLALEVFDAYATALETGDKSKFHDLVDKYIDNAAIDSFSDKNKSNKDRFDSRIDGFIEANEKEIVEQFAKGLREVNDENIEIGETFVGDYTVSFDYRFLPEGFFSRAYVKFDFLKLDNGDHVLEEIRIN